MLYLNRGDSPEALAAYERALRIYREFEYLEGQGIALGGIGSGYNDLGDRPQALASYEQALKIFREIGDHRGEGMTLGSIGGVYLHLGDYPRALAFYEQALGSFREIGDQNHEAGALTAIGLVYTALGDYPQALALYERAVMIHRQFKDRKVEAIGLAGIGMIYSGLGDSSKALSYYQQSLQIRQEIGLSTKSEEALIGDIYLEQGRLQEVYQVFQRLKMPSWLGRYYLRAGEHQQAQEEFLKSLRVSEKRESAELFVAASIGLGLALEGLHDYAGAKSAYQKAVDRIEQQREALTMPQRHGFFAAKVQGFSRLEPYKGLVRVAAALRETGESFFWAEHTKARLLLEATAQRGAGNQLGLPATLAQQEADLITRLAATAKQMERAFETSNMERYKALEQELTTLKQARDALIARLRQDYSAYAAIHYPQPIRITELRLKPGEALLAYEVTETATFSYLIKGNTVLKAFTIPVTRQALVSQVKQYRSFFEEKVPGKIRYADLADFDPRLGKTLYDLLVKDLVPFLSKGDRLILIPDEILGILPFEALVVELPTKSDLATGPHGPYPRGVRYLGDQYPISYYQSATALTLARTLPREDAGKLDKMLVLADPVFDDTDARLREGKGQVARRDEYQPTLMRAVEDYRKGGRESVALFVRLAMTGQLAEQLQRSQGQGVEVLRGLAASEPELRKRPLHEYSYQVFATHGILDEQVPYIREPALVLSQVGTNPKEPEQDGFLTLSEVMNLKLAAEVVALTACNTGMGKHLTGEGVMGMGRAFQYAGARSVLMSLWSVAEDSTILLTDKFFAYLKQGKDKLEALRLARADVRAAGYEHPFYWAPFILVGETDRRS